MILPHELVIQILLRLPVKSLIHFKCVCKLWLSLISHDSHFAKSHFQLTATEPNCRILHISNSTQSIDVEASLDSGISPNLDWIFPEYFTVNFPVKGSCRGFILFCGSLNIYVWNPSTGVHKRIPLSPFGSDLEAEYFYGFGYDDSTEDYLVVSMYHYNAPPLHLEYYSLKANTWKQGGDHCKVSSSCSTWWKDIMLLGKTHFKDPIVSNKSFGGGHGGWSEDRWKWGNLGLFAVVGNNPMLLADFLFLKRKLEAFSSVLEGAHSVKWLLDLDGGFSIALIYAFLASFRVPFRPSTRYDSVLGLV
ncbi:unnamed protein product [Vicia faba]|uniref:F-box domain-containing protein n=1 Tax=Vicia faba TaxID=3906 RepID=A0AAV1AMD5_VICFA|nr:unnamed protein product [Vicia faba]